MASKIGLKIIIVGCGKVGFTLVETLVSEGHDITVIDKDPDKVANITSQYDVMGFTGNGASYGVQMEADIENTDLFIAVTASDELNLLCCTVAKRVSKCSAIARVRHPDYSKEISYLKDRLGLAMAINPDLEAARVAARILALPTALEVSRFFHGQVSMIRIKLPGGNLLAGKTIAQLGAEVTKDILICGVERGDDVTIPSGDFKVESGDIISFLAPRAMSKTFLKHIGFTTHQVKDVMIIGGSKSAFYLADHLIKMNISVKIIEKDRNRCEQLSSALPKAIIIHGDGSNEDILKEEGIEYVEAFVPLTDMDEENIMLTLYAKKVSKAKVITKINHLTFKNVISSLDLGSVIYPKYVTSEAITAFVRAKKESMDSNIELLYHFFDHRAEAIEFRVNEKSGVIGKPLKDLRLKSGLLIACINHGGRIIIPSGNDIIHANDNVVIVTTNSGFTDVDDILLGKGDTA